MYEESGDTKYFGDHKFTCVNVVGDKAIADTIAHGLRIDGFRSRVTVRTRTHIKKEPPGSYFPTPPHFFGDILTYCVWKGAKK